MAIGSKVLSEAVDRFLGAIETGRETSAHVTAICSSPNSPLASLLGELAARLGESRAPISMAVVLGLPGSPEALMKLVTEVEGAASQPTSPDWLRIAVSGKLARCDEQLVLGRAAYFAGPSNAKAPREPSNVVLRTSDQEKDIAFATFAFDVAWEAAMPPAWPPIQKPARRGLFQLALAAYGLSALSMHDSLSRGASAN